MVKWTSPLSKYWILHRLSLGKCQAQKQGKAEEFLIQELTGDEEISDREIVTRLWKIYESESPDEPVLAKLCLRCIISHYLKNSCYELAKQYGQKHNFNAEDLFPFVLDSTDASLNYGNNHSLTARILQTFNLEKGSLSNWIKIIIKRNAKLKEFFLENGLELITNWLVLKQCTISKLQHILSDFYRYDSQKIQQLTQLLEGYHTIYLAQIQAERNEVHQQQERQYPPLVSTGKRKEIDPPLTPPRRGRQVRYPEPNYQQLLEIAERLSTTWKVSPEGVLKELQNLAQLIREYRVSRGKSVATQALGKHEFILPAPQADEDNEEKQFIAAFREHYDRCFLKAVQEVIEEKVNYYQNKKKPKHEQFIKALRLYHCQMVPMGEIAPQVGLKKQYQVSRLLEQTKIRDDIARRIVSYLIPQIFQFIPEKPSKERQSELRKKLTSILYEKVNTEMDNAQREDSVSRNRTMESKLSQTICRYLDRNLDENF